MRVSEGSAHCGFEKKTSNGLSREKRKRSIKGWWVKEGVLCLCVYVNIEVYIGITRPPKSHEDTSSPTYPLILTTKTTRLTLPLLDIVIEG